MNCIENIQPPWGPVALAKHQCQLRHVAASYPPRETTQGALVIIIHKCNKSVDNCIGGQCGIERVVSVRSKAQRGCSRHCGNG